jgi:hypothetical protein
MSKKTKGQPAGAFIASRSFGRAFAPTERQPIRVVTDADIVAAAGLTTASIDSLDGPDGLDEDLWNRAMEQACEQDGAR